jgi:hypothetical protein
VQLCADTGGNGLFWLRGCEALATLMIHGCPPQVMLSIQEAVGKMLMPLKVW